MVMVLQLPTLSPSMRVMPYPIPFSCARDIYYLMNILRERDYSLNATAEREIVQSLCFVAVNSDVAFEFFCLGEVI